ncbi:FecR domain-containing protein [Chloroflexota bacterium]
MRNKLTKILDECLERVEKGESIDACLADYPDMREELEPLLSTALSISSIPKVQPSSEFVNLSRFRLINRINQENARAEAIKPGQRALMLRGIPAAFHSAWQSYITERKVAIPVTAILLLILSAGLYQFGGFNFLSPTPAVASQATLTILSGSVEIQNPELTASQEGYDGMALSVGAGIKTGPDSHAIITFFEGSTAKLEPNTYLEIRQLEEGNEQSRTIILKQWLGRTWNRVIKITDPGSRYEIETPSATAIVRGTLFTTDVKGTGATTVSTKEGLVSVAAQGKEVFVPEDQQTAVEKGIHPSQPAEAPAPKSQIIVTVDAPAVSSVLDPTGSSTGILPTGEQFNQIQGSYSELPSEDTQIITVADPMTGEYVIVLRSPSEGVRHFHIEGKSEGKTVFSYTGDWDAQKESGKLIHLNLQIDNGLIVDDDISLVEPLGDKTPEKIIDRKSGDKGKPSVDAETEADEEEEIPGKDRPDDVKDGPPGQDRPDDVKDGPPGQNKTGDVKDGPSGQDRPDDVKDGPPGQDRPDDVKDGPPGQDKDNKDKPGKDRPDIKIDKDDVRIDRIDNTRGRKDQDREISKNNIMRQNDDKL